MRKLLMLLSIFVFITACGEKSEEQDVIIEGEFVEVHPEFDITFDNSLHVYNKDNVLNDCNDNNEILCAVDLVVKCTIDPKMEKCAGDRMPDFIFMEDESLERPTEISFRIEEIKTLNSNTIEVYTNSQCNGRWFGLCNNNVIYVLNNKSGSWTVRDIYAIENMY